jgi:microsomal epoxide hydrolase
MSGFDQLPLGAANFVKRIQVRIDDKKINQLKSLVEIAPVAVPTWENGREDRDLGVSREWLLNAKEHWTSNFSWREQEKFINRFPQFEAVVKDDDGSEFKVHFMALFSLRPDAIPCGFFHGWPGKFELQKQT